MDVLLLACLVGGLLMLFVSGFSLLLCCCAEAWRDTSAASGAGAIGC